ncbi:MAG: tetratricopeptide repeat protein [Acidobacteria bacterium]|nr:tetratricopeptide repeat protein [Acidobacteriota bacterium]
MDEPTAPQPPRDALAPLAHAHADAHVATWGPFKLIQKVGQGSFGEVYRAYDTTLEREVALKLLLRRGDDEEAQVQALLREARAIARVRHNNVVPVYGVDRFDGRVGFWSDFVNGKTLAAILALSGPFGPREAALIGVDVCCAVSAVHAAGLLHRDIKTGNVMREAGGRILLMDFGLTLHEHQGHQTFGGTPVYMAPELFRGAPASAATDLYAIGILLFHMLSARYPVQASTMDEMAARHHQGDRLSLLDIRPDLPVALARVIETAIHPDPQQRYKTAGQMIGALTETLDVTADPAEAAKPTRRILPWAIAAGAAVLALPFTLPQVRQLLFRTGTLHDDYQKAHELLDHYYRPNALQTVIPILEKIVAANPTFAPAFSDLGRAKALRWLEFKDSNLLEEARTASLRALQLKPDLPSAHVTLALLYMRTNKYDLASQELDEAIRLDRNYAPAYAVLGDMLWRQGRNPEAETTIEKGVSLAPDRWDVVQSFGQFYADTGKLEQASEQYLRAARLTPNNPRAHNNLAQVYRMQNKLEDSAGAFRKAIELEPTFSRYRNLGMVLLEQGKYAEAKPELDRAISMNPGHYRAYGHLATLYTLTSLNRDKAAETYRKAVELSEALLKKTPNDSYLLSDTGSYYASLGDAEHSLPLLRKAAAVAADRPEVLYTVAVAYELIHRRDDAMATLEKAVAAGMSVPFLDRNPQLSALRADPRYRAMINQAVLNRNKKG